MMSRSSAAAVKLWDPVSGHLTRTLEGLWGDIYSVAFTPDGRRLGAGASDGKVKIWDVASGQEVLTLKGHPSHVYSIAFSPDGRRLATAGLDGRVKIWDGPPLAETRAREDPADAP
jgi:WD40 repeat protein